MNYHTTSNVHELNNKLKHHCVADIPPPPSPRVSPGSEGLTWSAEPSGCPGGPPSGGCPGSPRCPGSPHPRASPSCWAPGLYQGLCPGGLCRVLCPGGLYRVLCRGLCRAAPPPPGDPTQTPGDTRRMLVLMETLTVQNLGRVEVTTQNHLQHHCSSILKL